MSGVSCGSRSSFCPGLFISSLLLEGKKEKRGENERN
jgi:hypothetical protein